MCLNLFFWVNTKVCFLRALGHGCQLNFLFFVCFQWLYIFCVLVYGVWLCVRARACLRLWRDPWWWRWWNSILRQGGTLDAWGCQRACSSTGPWLGMLCGGMPWRPQLCLRQHVSDPENLTWVFRGKQLKELKEMLCLNDICQKGGARLEFRIRYVNWACRVS